MGTTNPKHSHGGLAAAFAQHSFRNIRGNKEGVCTMGTPNDYYGRYYPKWDRKVRSRMIIPNLLKAKTAYERY